MSRFNLASDEDILAGGTTDIYFRRTEAILKRLGKDDQRVLAEFTASSLPHGWDHGVLCGLDEVLTLMEDRDVDIRALPEGSLFVPKTHSGVRLPVVTIEGPYGQFAVFETPILGFICQASGIATKASRVRRAAGDKQVISFGIRRMHPAVSPMIDRAAYVGGCDGVSSLSGAARIRKDPQGTMPHSLVIVIGDPRVAFAAFDEHMEESVPRIALVDTYLDEVREAIIAAETVEDLAGVRLDTHGSRKGNFEDIIREVRWELDIRGHEDVKIFVSGGLDEDTIPSLLQAGAEGFGVGTSISNAPTINFAMDIVEMDGRPVAKRGKFGGRKEVLRCPEDLTYELASRAEQCPACGGEMKPAMVEYMHRGKVVESIPPEDEVRAYVLEQLEKLPAGG
jgi:nicotinate phosphoribosyltransferase